MSSPMPLMPGAMCCLCFDQIYEGEHYVDEKGHKWDSHAWCRLMDEAMVLRRNAQQTYDDAMECRIANDQPVHREERP